MNPNQSNGNHITPDNHQLNPQINGLKPSRRKSKKKQDDLPSSSSVTSSNFSISNSKSNYRIQRGIRIPNKRRFNLNFRRNCSDVEAIAFPLGMSIAAVFAQVLERKDLSSDSTSVDYLSTICTSAVRESLTNVFGEKFDAFAMNFEKSFESTLSTLRLIRNSDIDSGDNQVGNSKVSEFPPDYNPDIGECSSRGDDITENFTESVNHDAGALQDFKANEVIEDRAVTTQSSKELPMQGIVSWQLSGSNQRYLSNQSVLSTIEKSVFEQTRANELKSLEIGLMMKKLQLKESQLALDSDSNFLERCKLSLGVSRTSFKMEKFKIQLEESKHAELLKTCADYLVAGLIIMSSCLCSGVYAFSYDNVQQLSKSCHPPEGTKFWWKPMASFNSGWQTLTCQFQIYSRIIFGVLIIGATALALVQRSNIASQAMPITFIVLLLGLLCGVVGKVCVDTLGGDGYTWLIFWEVFCTLHFFAIIFNPSLYFILYGTVKVFQGTKYQTLVPFWVRQGLFRLFLILIPVCCGLLPFASVSTWWKEHISSWIRNRWLVFKLNK